MVSLSRCPMKSVSLANIDFQASSSPIQKFFIAIDSSIHRGPWRHGLGCKCACLRPGQVSSGFSLHGKLQAERVRSSNAKIRVEKRTVRGLFRDVWPRRAETTKREMDVEITTGSIPSICRINSFAGNFSCFHYRAPVIDGSKYSRMECGELQNLPVHPFVRVRPAALIKPRNKDGV